MEMPAVERRIWSAEEAIEHRESLMEIGAHMFSQAVFRECWELGRLLYEPVQGRA